MKRTALLLLPVVAMALAAPESAERQSRAEILGTLWQESLSAETSGEPTKAADKLAEFTKAGGDPYLSNLRGGWLQLSAKNYDQAANLYAAAMKLQPDALNPRLGLLKVAQAKADSAATVKMSDLVLKLDTTNYSALMAIAGETLQAKDYRRAKAAYQKVLGLYPEDQDAISGTAWCHFYLGMKREAQAGFQKLMSLNPDYPHVREGVSLTTK